MQKKGKLFILSAPSGSGKTTLEKMLLSSNLGLENSISVTTRKPRRGEKNGKDYYFISKEEFFKKRKRGNFLEWAKVFDHYYGTPRDKVEQLLAQGRSILLSIDIQGTKQIKEIYPEAVCIFIKPPNISELEKRLKRRSADRLEDIKKRLLFAKREISQSGIYNYVVINDKIEKAYKELRHIIKKHIRK